MLINVSIYQFHGNNILKSRIEASQINISNNPWLIQSGFKIDFENENKREDFQNLEFNSTFSKEKLNSVVMKNLVRYRILLDTNKMINIFI